MSKPLMSAIKEFSDAVAMATMDDVVKIELTPRTFGRLAKEMYSCGYYEALPATPTKVYGITVVSGEQKLEVSPR